MKATFLVGDPRKAGQLGDDRHNAKRAEIRILVAPALKT